MPLSHNPLTCLFLILLILLVFLNHLRQRATRQAILRFGEQALLRGGLLGTQESIFNNYVIIYSLIYSCINFLQKKLQKPSTESLQLIANYSIDFRIRWRSAVFAANQFWIASYVPPVNLIIQAVLHALFAESVWTEFRSPLMPQIKFTALMTSISTRVAICLQG